jgi:hypothetical protein
VQGQPGYTSSLVSWAIEDPRGACRRNRLGYAFGYRLPAVWWLMPVKRELYE